MAELELSRDQRLALRARAQGLKPVVLLGAAGLTEAVLKEVSRALDAHELIKVRVPGDDRSAREDFFNTLAQQLGAARVQSIGKLLVLYRPKPEEKAPSGPAARRAERAPPLKSPQTGFKPQRNEIRQAGRRVAPRRTGRTRGS